MMLDLAETSDFYFDPVAAERPIKFIEKFIMHYEGRHAGDPFLLHETQKRIVRDIFGWKHRDTGLRRFSDVYLEGAVGSGKSPLLAGLGLYCLMADGERGAQVYSIASTFAQARVVFNAAQKFGRLSPELARRLIIVEREIRHPLSGSFWRIVPGKGPGAGANPSLILGDEVHEWERPGGFNVLRERMFKRQQPLAMVATNAGRSRTSFCWQLRERAVAALAGTGETTLYPVIFCADEDARTDDPEAWRAANPLINVTIAESKVRQVVTGAMNDPNEEAEARRLYLGIWPKSAAGRWLDLSQWDDVTVAFNASACIGAPLYVGIDLAPKDDLSAAVYIWATPGCFWLTSHFWMPRETAQRYTDRDGVPYLTWAEQGHVTLLDEPTISPAIRRMIATRILKITKPHKLKAVCYDRYKADETVAVLEGAGVTCVPIAQGYTVSPGCSELERRLKERSIKIAPNPVLRFCAENVEVKIDDRGNLWPVKPGANAHGGDGYKGRRGAKIDGITAAVTALTEARRNGFPSATTHGRAFVCSI